MKSLTDIFSDFIEEVKHTNYNKEVEIIRVPCCHNDDQEPITLIWPDVERGPWIAGGACLRWYQGQPVSENDIDVFCSSPKQALELVEKIKSYGRYSTKHESENATTLSYHNKAGTKYWTLQIIKRRYFNNIQEVLDNFDITVCQIGTGGQEWVMGPYTAKDIREKNLRMNKPLHPDASKRLVKYWTYGYRPVEGLLDDIRNNPEATKVFQADGDYENAF